MTDFKDVKVGDTVYFADGREGRVSECDSISLCVNTWWYSRETGKLNSYEHLGQIIYPRPVKLTIEPRKVWVKREAELKTKWNTGGYEFKIPPDARNVTCTYEVESE